MHVTRLYLVCTGASGSGSHGRGHTGCTDDADARESGTPSSHSVGSRHWRWLSSIFYGGQMIDPRADTDVRMPACRSWVRWSFRLGYMAEHARRGSGARRARTGVLAVCIFSLRGPESCAGCTFHTLVDHERPAAGADVHTSTQNILCRDRQRHRAPSQPWRSKTW